VTKYKQFWPTRCFEWQTLNTDPAFGIQCNDVRIWTNTHPYPKKVGNLLESIVTEVLKSEVLEKGMLTCGNANIIQEPNGIDEVDCSYGNGGMFIRAKARDIIFEGYTDPFTIKVMNMHFEMENRGYQIVCNDPVEISFAYDCAPIYDVQCGEEGFSVVKDDGTVLAKLLRNTREWCVASRGGVPSASELWGSRAKGFTGGGSPPDKPSACPLPLREPTPTSPAPLRASSGGRVRRVLRAGGLLPTPPPPARSPFNRAHIKSC
jgi:hypothetical protein